jgi:NADH:ubiquinone oxidoreductase subunit F (NADH-binding)
VTAPVTSRPPASGEARLMPAGAPLDLAAHLDRYGPPPLNGSRTTLRGSQVIDLIAEVERSGLTGRGGGAFPAGRKLRAVAEAATRRAVARSAGGHGAVVVANGSESEPASHKDSMLLRAAPHLVLDGLALAAEAVGASRTYLCVGDRAEHEPGPRAEHEPGPRAEHEPGPRAEHEPGLREAIAQRERAGLGQPPVELARVPHGYLAGQETALISFLNGGAGRPTVIPPRPAERGAHRRPTLVMNVETLAHVALIARYGADWFRELGTVVAPGSALVTISGSVARPGVYEIPLGMPLGDLLRRADPRGEPQAVLTGGYFGTWLPLPAALRQPVSDDGLRAAGAALGPGVLAVLPDWACGLAETARVTGYLASQIAGQCGPCSNGMPALAQAMNWVAFGQPGDDLIGWTRELTRLITGRGACHLPDGAAGLVTSALRVFAADVRAHAEGGPCERAGRPPVLPGPGGSSR